MYKSWNGKSFINEIAGQESFNKEPLRPLNEITTNRLLGKHAENGFVILSSMRQNLSDDENDSRSQKLINQLQSSSNIFSFLPCYGGYIENKGTPKQVNVYERSIILFNFDKKGNITNFNDLRKKSQELCKQFQQEEFLIKEPGKPPYYVRTNDGTKTVQFTGDIKIDDLASEFFTKLRRGGKQFTFEGVYCNPEPACYSERHVRHLQGEIF